MATLQYRRLLPCFKHLRCHSAVSERLLRTYHIKAHQQIASTCSLYNLRSNWREFSPTRCLSSKSNVSVEPNWYLQHIWVASNVNRFEEQPFGVGFNVGFIDTAHGLSLKEKANMPIILAVHGIPGTHEDLAHFLERYAQQGFRVIIPNLPSFGITTFIERSTMRYFSHSTEEQVDFIVQFLSTLGVSKLHLVVGHSVGTLPLTVLCAKSTKSIIKGAVFLCPIHGHKLPRGMQPKWLLEQSGIWFYSNFICRWIVVQVYKQIIAPRNKVKKSSSEEVGAIIQTGYNMGFDYLPGIAMEMDIRKIPLLYVITEDDPLIDASCSKEYAYMLGVAERHFAVYDQIGNLVRQGDTSSRSYSRGVLFKGNSHKPHMENDYVETLHGEMQKILQYIDQEK